MSRSTSNSEGAHQLPITNTPGLRGKVRVARVATNLGYRLSRLGLRRWAAGRWICETIDRAVAREMNLDELVLSDVRGMPLFVRKGTYDTGAYLHRPYEPATTRLFERLVRPGAVVLDVGAQFGYFSLLAARRAGPTGQIIAVEPVRDNLDLLHMNLAFNGYESRVRVVECALGEHEEVQTMYIYRDSDSHAFYKNPDAEVRDEIEVQLVPGDEITKGAPVDIIKMDVEGHEEYALRGLKETLAASKYLVLIAEYAPDYLRRAGTDPAEYLDYIRDLGFSIEVIDEDSGKTGPFTRAVREGLGERPNVNLLCTKGRTGPG